LVREPAADVGCGASSWSMSDRECLDFLLVMSDGLLSRCSLHANSVRAALGQEVRASLLALANVTTAFVVPRVLGVGAVALPVIGSHDMGLVPSASKGP
jgi:hypothetical protein